MNTAANYHAAASPSSAHMWLSCGASLAMGAKYPNKSSGYADEGTAAHALAADCLNFEADAKDFIGQNIVAGSSTFCVTPVFAEGVQLYLDLVRERIEHYRLLAYDVQLHVEVQVPTESTTGEAGATGTSDAVLVCSPIGANAAYPGGVIEVIDLKFGQGVTVHATENPQGKIYALGAIEKFNAQDFAAVVIVISQPRITQVASEWSTTPDDLLKWRDEVVRPQAKIALHNLTEKRIGFELNEFGPSEKACKFCRAKADCPALKEYTQETMRVQFDDIDPLKPDTCPKQKLEALSVEELGEVFGRIGLVQDYLTAVAARVAELALNGTEVPGVKVVRGRKGNRAWSDSDAVEEMLKEMRVKHDVIYDYKLASPTTIEKKVAKENPRKWKRIAACITQADGKLQAAPEWDDRPAVEVTPVAASFDDVNDSFNDSFNDLE